MTRRILVNLFIAFVLLSFLKFSWDFITIIILKDYSAFSGTFLEYQKMIAVTAYIQVPILFLITVLLPYQIIINRLSRTKNLKLIHKILLFELVLVIFWCLLGTFLNVWLTPYWKNLYYPIIFLLIAVPSAFLLHWLVDTKVEKNKPV